MSFDAAALDWFDRLVTLAPPERAAQLDALAQTDPALHGRVSQMLATLDDAEASRALRLSPEALADAPLHAGDLVAGWRLERPLGQGGMASVWLAVRADGELQRRAALKLPLHRHGQLAERFERERDLLAALDHPHIARLYDAGRAADGRPYLALEYVDGSSLDQAAATLDRDARIRLMLQVLDAVAHAHRHMAVHRDLKPANILVNAEGQVKLLDFGIAKLLEPGPEAAALTLDAGALMTPLYAAPEQVAGGVVTTGTDVHAAAVVLYELLTGRLPRGARGQPLAQALHAITHEQPAPPGLGADLDAVLLKGLAADPRERYASADALADDLRRVLAHEPVQARRTPIGRRLSLWLRRNRGLSLAGTSVLLLLGAAGLVAALQWRESQAQRARADAVRDFILRALSEAEPDEGQREVSARALIEGAVARARADFGDQPRLQGELLSELGRVQLRLNEKDPEAVKTLEAARDLLTREAPPGDGARHLNEALLGLSLSGGPDKERAFELARGAQAACTAATPLCAQARYQAAYAMATIESQRGRNAEALVHARAMRSEADRPGSPLSLRERIGADETVAATARNAGALEEGLTAIRAAVRQAQGLTLKASNRQRMQLIEAALNNDLGHHAEAAATLLALAREAPSPSERALRLNLANQALLGAGQPAEAMARVQEAVAALGQGGTAGERAFLQQGLARTAGVVGELDLADRSLAEARRLMAEAGFKTGSNALLRLDRLEGELMLRRKQPAEALRLLRDLRSQETRVRPTEAARTLELLGCAAQERGDRVAAEAAWREGRGLLEPLLPAEHPRLRWLAARLADATGSCTPL